MRKIKSWTPFLQAGRSEKNESPWIYAQLRILLVFIVWALLTAPEVGSASEPVTAVPHSTVSSLIAEGKKLVGQHRYPEAEKAFRLALTRTPSGDNKNIVDILNYIGATLHAQSKESEAIAYFNKALTALPKKLPGGDLRRAKILSNLSLIYSHQSQTAKAMELSEEAISIFHAQKAPPSEFAILLNSYGRLKMEAGDLKKAESLFEESVEVREKIAGKSSVTLVSPLINLSNAYVQEGKLQEAESTCRRAIIICQQQDGNGSEMLFPLLCNLGSLQVEQNRREEAISSFKKAKEIAEKYFGRNSEECLTTFFALSEFYEKEGQSKEAEEALSRAVEISRLLYGPRNSKTIDATLALAQLYQMHGNSLEADRLRTLCRLSK